MNELQVFVIPTRLDRFENWQVLDYEFLPWANMIDMVLIAAWSVETAVLVVGKWACYAAIQVAILLLIKRGHTKMKLAICTRGL